MIPVFIFVGDSGIVDGGHDGVCDVFSVNEYIGDV